MFCIFFFNDTATTEIYTLSLHDALPILPLVEMCRYEPDGTATVIGATGDHPFQPGTNWSLDGPSLTALVRRTQRPARIDDYADVSGRIGDAAREAGVHAGVGAPIVVDDRVWGVV